MIDEYVTVYEQTVVACGGRGISAGP